MKKRSHPTFSGNKIGGRKETREEKYQLTPFWGEKKRD